MQKQTIYDIIGIGIGPFNLGLAALTEPIKELKCLFLEQNEEFNWHPGLMLDNARLQVPFYADLVTLADPCSKYSYMSFLKAKGRMFRFAILEDNFILRREYNEYCRWVIRSLSAAADRDDNGNLEFGIRVEAVYFDEVDRIYSVYAKGNVFYCKHLVIGVGSVPHMPFAKQPTVFHSSEYLDLKLNVLGTKSVAIVGSGQSAAEIFYDMLKYTEGIELKWFTRSAEFFPMDYSPFALEKTSPDYIDHFYSLPIEKRNEVLSKQDHLYKGINLDLIKSIYAEMYYQRLGTNPAAARAGLVPGAELKKIIKGSEEEFDLTFYHNELDKEFGCTVGAVILATGYRYEQPVFLKPIRHLLTQPNRNYSIDKNNSIFVQNAELHTHGFNAPDLGMGPYRNSVIINSILGREYYKMESGIAFQKFSP